MHEERRIYCPHCREVGPGVWVGYGRNWVLCPHCQRRVAWTEVKAWHLIEEERESESKRSKGSYH